MLVAKHHFIKAWLDDAGVADMSQSRFDLQTRRVCTVPSLEQETVRRPQKAALPIDATFLHLQAHRVNENITGIRLNKYCLSDSFIGHANSSIQIQVQKR